MTKKAQEELNFLRKATPKNILYVEKNVLDGFAILSNFTRTHLNIVAYIAGKYYKGNVKKTVFGYEVEEEGNLLVNIVNSSATIKEEVDGWLG